MNYFFKFKPQTMKKIVLFFVVFSLQSCTLDFDTETRIALKGKIVNQNTMPIANINICVYAIKEGTQSGLGCFDCDRSKLMIGQTNENGEFIIFSPLPSNVSYYNVLINTTEETEPWGGISVENPNYKNIRIFNITNDRFSDYTLDIGVKTLEFN